MIQFQYSKLQNLTIRKVNRHYDTADKKSWIANNFQNFIFTSFIIFRVGKKRWKKKVFVLIFSLLKKLHDKLLQNFQELYYIFFLFFPF